MGIKEDSVRTLIHTSSFAPGAIRQKAGKIAHDIIKKIDEDKELLNNKAASKTYLKIRYVERSIASGKNSFVTMDNLNNWTNEWMKTFSTRYDLVIGVPRSGLFVANRIALLLGKPLSTPELFTQNLTWQSQHIKKSEIRKILLVEDSADTCKSLDDAYTKVTSTFDKKMVTKTALIVTEQSKKKVDDYYKVIPQPRQFEWNLMHAKKGRLASDLDGVLCENCPSGVDRDETKYLQWIKNAKPYRIPNFKIDVIVSNRLEKYRAITEEWLLNNEVKYGELLLWDIPSKQDRQGRHGERKAEEILRIKPDFVWESSIVEAKKIWDVTHVPTICFDEMIMYS